MMSPYIRFIYFFAYIANSQKILVLITPLSWLCVIGGLYILTLRSTQTYQSMYDPIAYYVLGAKTDIRFWVYKIIWGGLLLYNNTPITKESLLFTIFICTVYVFVYDVLDIYQIR